jgi:hypothetical protein
MVRISSTNNQSVLEYQQLILSEQFQKDPSEAIKVFEEYLQISQPEASAS